VCLGFVSSPFLIDAGRVLDDVLLRSGKDAALSKGMKSQDTIAWVTFRPLCSLPRSDHSDSIVPSALMLPCPLGQSRSILSRSRHGDDILFPGNDQL